MAWLRQADEETVSGEALVALIEATPVDDASDIAIDSDFLPLVKEVLGSVPGIVLQVGGVALVFLCL